MKYKFSIGINSRIYINSVRYQKNDHRQSEIKDKLFETIINGIIPLSKNIRSNHLQNINDQRGPSRCPETVDRNKNKINCNGNNPPSYRYISTKFCLTTKLVPNGLIQINSVKDICNQQNRNHTQSSPILFILYEMFKNILLAINDFKPRKSLTFL